MRYLCVCESVCVCFKNVEYISFIVSFTKKVVYSNLIRQTPSTFPSFNVKLMDGTKPVSQLNREKTNMPKIQFCALS